LWSCLNNSQYGSDGSLVGNWLYRVGSCSYFVQSTITLASMGGIGKKPSKWWLNLLITLCFIAGATLFFIGGVFFLEGIIAGAIVWAVGSFCFLLGSLVYLGVALFY